MTGTSASLGGAETLVLHPASTSHRQMDAASLRAVATYCAPSGNQPSLASRGRK